MLLKESSQTIFYTIEESIKEYRKLCQYNISKKVSDLTVDQTMLLFMIHKNKDLSQKELAEILFKDHASITRMIELMVKKNYLTRKLNTEDRRRFSIELTPDGKKAITLLTPVIKKNRQIALDKINLKNIDSMNSSLQKMIINCKKRINE